MNRMHVISSDLRSVGYDPALRILEVEFHDRSVYVYRNVPESVYSALMCAPSKGTFFARNIWPFKMKYPCQKIFG